MKKYVILYNPYSANNNGLEYAKTLENIYDSNVELIYESMPLVEDFKKFFKKYHEDIIICGGDGTLNYFINHTNNIKYDNVILYYATGSGNDFHNDIGNKVKIPYEINQYLKDLPTVTVKGKDYKFLNNVGYGIDGYCCEEGDLIRERTSKPVNYTKIAIKGLLFKFKPRNAKVWVDGKYYEFKDAWLVPTMNGRFYGGGMMIAPNQYRLNKNHLVTLVIMNASSRLETLLTFPKIFKGEHINHKMITVLEGHDIKVSFDIPCPLQIDGETINDVLEYHVVTE